jgi:hypothetical protein
MSRRLVISIEDLLQRHCVMIITQREIHFQLFKNFDSLLIEEAAATGLDLPLLSLA